jgi:hypothetical protein
LPNAPTSRSAWIASWSSTESGVLRIERHGDQLAEVGTIRSVQLAVDHEAEVFADAKADVLQAEPVEFGAEAGADVLRLILEGIGGMGRRPA